MSISAFNDKSCPPAEAELHTALGSRLEWWLRITAFMFETYQLPGLMSYGGKNYGWNLWFRRGSRPLLSLYPQTQGLTAQVVLGKAEVAKALNLALGTHIDTVLRETKAFHDGLWLFIPLESSQDVEDILQLVMVKSRPKKNRAVQPS
jgi:hypothetical protein